MKNGTLLLAWGILSLLFSGVALGQVAGHGEIGLEYERLGHRVQLVSPQVVEWIQGKKNPLPGGMEVPRHHAPINPIQSLDGYEAVSSSRLVRQFKFGEAVVFHYSSGKAAWEPVTTETATTLSQEAAAAVELAPDWIKVRLVSILARLDKGVQDDLARLMTQVEDPRYLDEIAFLIATLTVGDLTHPSFRARYIADQPKLIYEADPMLDYVELVDVGDPGKGDYHTTAVYRLSKDGDEFEWTLPKEYYYWWVVHTRLDGEELFDVNPTTGKFAGYPKGLTFREYFLFPDPAKVDTYMRHYVFKKPPEWEIFGGLDDNPFEALSGWKPSQKGYFTQMAIGPSLLTTDSSGRATTIEFKVRPKGHVLATTLAVEKGYSQKKSNLLRSMLRYGPGLVVQDPKQKHLVIMERPPFGLDGIIEGVLDEYKVNYQVISAAELADVDLAEVRKIIVPSDQPLAVYQAVADNREKLEKWLSEQWRIFELHGAVATVDDDWSGLVMPGNFTAAEVAGAGDDEVNVEGFPRLSRIIADTGVAWDGKSYALSGDRVFEPATFAIDKIGWFSSQNIWDSIIDWSEKHPWLPGPERTVQANRLIYNHFGNCGENQDIVTAASRSVLIPASNTNNSCEDHVWSEFFLDDGWHTYQIGWADGGTDIDAPGISSGKKHGGGKNNSFVVQTKGDGALVNHTDTYHYTGNIHFTVVDGGGNPIQGAAVLIVTESYYANPDGTFPLTFGFWDITDSQGKVTVQVGANIEDPMSNCLENPDLRCNNYYVKVVTSIGNFPPEEGVVSKVVDQLEATKDFEKDVTITVEGTAPAVVRPEGALEYAGGNEAAGIAVEVPLLREMACGISLYSGKYCGEVGDPLFGFPGAADAGEDGGPEGTSGQGALDFYLLDSAGFQAWSAGQPFEALVIEEGLTEGYTLAVHPPQFGDWYALFLHQSRYQHEMLADVKLTALAGNDVMPEPSPEPAAEDVSEPFPQDGVPTAEVSAEVTPAPADEGMPASPKKDGGCGAGPGASGSGPLVGLLVLLALLVAARLRDSTS